MIVDETGAKVKGVDVTGDWTLNGAPLNTVTKGTNKNGQVRLESDKVPAQSGDIFTITVTGVAKAGFTYDPTQNVKTTDSVTLP